MNIYIISNYYKIDTNIFKMIKPVDLVVFMNHHFHDGPFFNNNEKLLFIRRNPAGYWGYKDNYNNRYKEIYFVNGNLDDKELKTNIDTCPKILLKNFIKNYTKNKTPTTGFFTYSYLRNKYPDANIFLIGFTGGSSYSNKSMATCHDYKYEQQYYRDNNVNLLNQEYIKPNNIKNLLLKKNSMKK